MTRDEFLKAVAKELDLPDFLSKPMTSQRRVMDATLRVAAKLMGDRQLFNNGIAIRTKYRDDAIPFDAKADAFCEAVQILESLLPPKVTR